MHEDLLMAYLVRSFEHAAKVVCRKTAKKTKPGFMHAKGALFLGPLVVAVFVSVAAGMVRKRLRRKSSSVLSAPPIWRFLPSCGVARFGVGSESCCA